MRKEMRCISPVHQGFITQNNWNNNRASLESVKQKTKCGVGFT